MRTVENRDYTLVVSPFFVQQPHKKRLLSYWLLHISSPYLGLNFVQSHYIKQMWVGAAKTVQSCQVSGLSSDLFFYIFHSQKSSSSSSCVRSTCALLTVSSSTGFKRLVTSLRLVSWRMTWVKYFSRLICSLTAYGTSGITQDRMNFVR